MTAIHWFDSLTSTNTRLREMADAPHATVVACREQTAGRGQRGNSWEAEPRRNLTLSILARPRRIAAASQFAISRATALGVVDTLRRLMPGLAEPVMVKWPNDIYVGDCKICGILIENILTGSDIDRSIIGIGLNVNQTRFLSDAPNPVSMAMLTGREYPLDDTLRILADNVINRIDSEDLAGGNLSADEYFANLWHADGLHSYADSEGDFRAEIVGVSPIGLLTLRREDGTLRQYAFKEVIQKITD